MKQETYCEFPPIYICLDSWINEDMLLQNGCSKTCIQYVNFLFDVNNNGSENKINVEEYENGAEEFDISLKQKNNSLSHFVQTCTTNISSLQLQPNHDHESFQTVTKIYALRLRQMCYKVQFSPVKRNKNEMRLLEFTVPEGSYYGATMFVGVNPEAADDSDLYRMKKGNSYDVYIDARRAIALEGSDCNKKEGYDEIACQRECENKNYLSHGFCADVKSNSSLDDVEEILLCDICINKTSNEFTKNCNDLTNANLSNVMDVSNFADDTTNGTLGNKIVTVCEEKCKPSCNSTSYQTSIYLWQESDSSYITLYFHLEYCKYGIETLQDVPTFTWVSLVSNVGGQLGLWLGFSIVTLVQITFHFVNICIRKRKLTKSKQSTISNISV